MIISGPVIKGLGLGKKLGSPTINLDPANAPKDLEYGVYSVVVETPVGKFLGAMHFGPRPSIPNVPISLEVYCIGLNENLYGKTVEIEVKKQLRDIKKFANLEDLKKQISKDIEEAKTK